MTTSAIKTSGIVSMEKNSTQSWITLILISGLMIITMWLEETYWSVRNCITFRFDHYNDNIDRLAFFEELNLGWYEMYIYPYDDLYLPTISEERNLRLSQEPYTFYVTEEEFDHLMSKVKNPSLEELYQHKIT